MFLGKKWVKITLCVLALWAAASVLAYSFIGETNDQGDLVINRWHQAFLVLITLGILILAIKSLRTKK
ncbi:MAG TPA: hypothetical protein VFH37_01710 [Candidatus Saccharimonadales bacterium]|nr:hypothetical protein [Candidatus Saccharimonadales bacterium]